MSINHYTDNCKIYTPEKIAIQMIRELDIHWDRDIKILEPAVGTGNIFIPLLKEFLVHFKSLNDDELSIKLQSTFFCFDLESQSLNELKNKINNLFKKYDRVYKDEINIFTTNILTHVFKEKYDYIICNPPYITKRNLSRIQIDILKKSNTCKKYNYDLYFYFFEKSIDILNENGDLCFITPNSYLNSTSAFALRTYILDNTNIINIINYSNSTIFKNALVKVCITHLHKGDNDEKYIYTDVDEDITEEYLQIPDNFLLEEIHPVQTKDVLSDHFYISGGIATLNDDFFVINQETITDIREGVVVFRKKIDNVTKEFEVEEVLLKDVIRPSKRNAGSKIIYPYNDVKEPFSIEEIENNYPLFYQYINSYNFAENKTHSYGRSQGLKFLNEEKIVIPKITSNLNYIISSNALVMSGIYLVPQTKIAHELLQNRQFNYESLFKHIKKYCKNHGKGTYTINTTIIKDTPIEMVRR